MWDVREGGAQCCSEKEGSGVRAGKMLKHYSRKLPRGKCGSERRRDLRTAVQTQRQNAHTVHPVCSLKAFSFASKTEIRSYNTRAGLEKCQVQKSEFYDRKGPQRLLGSNLWSNPEQRDPGRV